MDTIKIRKGETLHEAGSELNSIEIISNGQIAISSPYSQILLGNGDFVGLSDLFSKRYSFYYEVTEDTTLYSYKYEGPEDISKVLDENKSIASILLKGSIKSAVTTASLLDNELVKIQEDFLKLKTNYSKYPTLCAILGKETEDFPELKDIEPIKDVPEPSKWKKDFFEGLSHKDIELKDSVLLSSSDITAGIILGACDYLRSLSEKDKFITAYRNNFYRNSAAFSSTFKMLENDLSKEKDATESFDYDSLNNSLSQILDYSEINIDEANEFKRLIKNYKLSTNTGGEVSDSLRSSEDFMNLRRNISEAFYSVYYKAFIKSLDDEKIPDVMYLFFYFGYVDEELVSSAKIEALYKAMKFIHTDPENIVYTMYDFLKEIYVEHKEPSNSEHGLDYPSYLKAQISNGDISVEKAGELLHDRNKRIKFEIGNLFKTGNKVTYGRSTSFIPILTESSMIKSVDDSLISPEDISIIIQDIRSIDYSCFYNNVYYTNPEFGIRPMYLSKEIMPTIILMPNAGSNTLLWQVEEGKHKGTPARMLISILHQNKLQDSISRLCAEYRWELCKSSQGIHWNNPSVPSLTSLYYDYLDSYKKNRALSLEQKEKIKSELSKSGNNFKNVFIRDYLDYINFEKSGSPRLNKVARSIMFQFCPFSAKICEKLHMHIAFTDLVNKENAKNTSTLRMLDNIITKINKYGKEIPPEISEHYALLKKH